MNEGPGKDIHGKGWCCDGRMVVLVLSVGMGGACRKESMGGGYRRERAIVVVPKSAPQSWPREIANWTWTLASLLPRELSMRGDHCHTTDPARVRSLHHDIVRASSSSLDNPLTGYYGSPLTSAPPSTQGRRSQG